MSEWTSVNDRLPVDKDHYSMRILCFTHEGVCCAWFPDGFDKKGIVGGWESCNYCGGQSEVHFIDDGRPYTSAKITHWMPLPEPPEEK